MKTKTNLIFHPFLLTIYPILFILAGNLKQIPAVQSVRPLLISLALSIVLFFILGGISKNFKQGAISVSLILSFVFFLWTYTPFHVFALSRTIPHIALGGFGLSYYFLE